MTGYILAHPISGYRVFRSVFRAVRRQYNHLLIDALTDEAYRLEDKNAETMRKYPHLQTNPDYVKSRKALRYLIRNDRRLRKPLQKETP